MSDAQTTSDKPEDSFLSSTGISLSSVIMTGGILVMAFLVLTLLGHDATTSSPESQTDETVAAQSVEPKTDIAGAAATTDD